MLVIVVDGGLDVSQQKSHVYFSKDPFENLLVLCGILTFYNRTENNGLLNRLPRFSWNFPNELNIHETPPTHLIEGLY